MRVLKSDWLVRRVTTIGLCDGELARTTASELRAVRQLVRDAEPSTLRYTQMFRNRFSTRRWKTIWNAAARIVSRRVSLAHARVRHGVSL